MSNARFIISQPGKRTREMGRLGRLISIGRAQDNAVCFEGDGNVSKYHAVVETQDGELWLSDLGSTNGTTVNGAPVVTSRRLEIGDLICVGGESTIEVGPAATGDGDDSADAPSPTGDTSGANSSAANSSAAASQVNHAAPPAQTSGGLSPLVIVALVVGVLAVIVGALVLLFSARSEPERMRSERETYASANRDDFSDSKTPETSALNDNAANVSASPTGAQAQATPPEDDGARVSEEEIKALCESVAAKLAPARPVVFDAQFVQQIRARTKHYATAGFYARARQYRDAINEAFVGEQGIEASLAYLTAMSRSRFQLEGAGAGEAGLWRLPVRLAEAQGYLGQCGARTLSDADQNCSARVAAVYLKQLTLGLFQDDYVSAVACFGMTPKEAAEWRARLPEDRRDFWRLVRAGIASTEQRERVVNFFAAAVVSENPQRFGLNTDRPLSDLYGKK